MKEKIVLAYSGGLDTSVAVQWLIDKGYDVVACCLDVGEGKDLDEVYQKALDMGAIECYIIDATEEFSDEYVSYAIKGNLMYENTYPVVSALSRPLISKKLVEIAEKTDAVGIAHGCTGKGNDQVRFEVAIKALNPELKVFAPVRAWGWSREEEIDYAIQHNIPVPINHDSPYSIDQNLWGRANECGILEDPYAAPPADAFDLTREIEDTPDTPDEIVIHFEKGLPVSIDDKAFPLDELILYLNDLAGKHGIGRIDHVENRLVGIKSREIYETPGAEVILKAHKALETITLTKDVAHFKPVIEKQFAEQTYNGLWFSPLTDSLKLFIDSTQEHVTGDVRVKLFKGNATVNGRRSPYSLYNEKLATYTKEDAFNQEAAVGFIEIYGLPTEVNSMLHGGYSNEQ
ncbi:argininosuccinate synthase [Staphylococcus carnosus]|uniref:Argininosuccinate synthase n=1 Tax=Staphylococcus carnosus (strain TM300) TaxID=396513 RepID=ASSY_STACT|nr:argininosuccinate synthase [Staphylococcus carnosus]B9DIU4.1 RecName: Full=Argininosuccinate synthase; AltName: Full=Citrulline--aspartate ligase [Staphylococcus carnosus subsp. carnosus TM300]POA03294.1 argininosuccinate synthase [Staphylococcus carnosus]QPT03660.1 argininosuccinate synthase [Staphylococcus carnosus]QRQ05694.1 argininosuccinate synthase [Staphylococcus carnosus]UQA66383.1 argininosuccinate synthase [Staphylococcus carnosus]UTB78782.1 argininosuccinate synthase [Staphyloco